MASHRGEGDRCARSPCVLWVFALLFQGMVMAFPTVKQKGTHQRTSQARDMIVMDVDAGADDAVAMLLALGHERHWLADTPHGVIAVTCVHGNTNLSNVVRNVFRTLRAANRMDVPVYAGASRSLLTTPPSDNYFGADGFGDIGVEPEDENGAQQIQKQHAVNALVDAVKKNPREVTLLCLGPLTNVALAERMYEGFVSQLKQLIVLGGSVEGHGNVRPGIEFNAYMDPEAFSVVLEAAQRAKRPLLLVPWETILKRVRLSLDWRRSVLGALDSEAMRLLNRVEARHLGVAQAAAAAATEAAGHGEDAKGESWWPNADAVATAVALQPALATKVTEPLLVQVAVGSGPWRATLQVDYGNVTGVTPNARIVMGLDNEGFKQLLLQSLADV